MTSAKDLFIALGLLIPVAIVVIVVLVMLCIKHRRRRKRKHFKEVSFKDNPIMTGRLPDTPRSSRIHEFKSENKGVVEIMPSSENETSFIVEYKATPGQVVSDILKSEVKDIVKKDGKDGDQGERICTGAQMTANIHLNKTLPVPGNNENSFVNVSLNNTDNATGIGVSNKEDNGHDRVIGGSKPLE